MVKLNRAIDIEDADAPRRWVEWSWSGGSTAVFLFSFWSLHVICDESDAPDVRRYVTFGIDVIQR